MRVAFIVSEFPALSETFILNQITGLMDRGHDVDIYADNPRETGKVHPDVTAYGLISRTHYRPMPASRVARVAALPRILWRHYRRRPLLALRCLNGFRYGRNALSLHLVYDGAMVVDAPPYDAVVSHFGYNGLKAAALRDAGVLSGRQAVVFHSLDLTTLVDQRGTGVYRDLFQSVDLALPISDHWRERLIELGCDESKIVVHRMGVDTAKFTFRSPTRRDGQPVRIVSVARLVEMKGIEFGIRAVAELARAEEAVMYTIVGDGPLMSRLVSLVEKLGAQSIVSLKGWKDQSEVAAILEESDILLAPSITGSDGDQEGIPVAQMEAMASGLPVVSTAYSGIAELVEDSKSGFLVPERDVVALADRLSRLVHDPELRAAMAAAGRARVAQHYDINVLNARLVSLLQGMGDPSRRTEEPAPVPSASAG